MVVDWKGVAGRIKGLINLSDRAQLPSAAARLGVDEQTLRQAIEEESPSSTLKVISALIRVYGLDPTWVMTGAYDAATHRKALEGDAGTIDGVLSEILAPPLLDGRAREKELRG